LALGQIFYHSMAEMSNMLRDDFTYTAQRHFRKNIPFVDTRGFDNVGWQEGTPAPASFQSSSCLTYNPGPDDL
jgi:hypothetical protein